MSGRNALRGSRAGAGPTGEPVRGASEPRTTVTFWCASDHDTSASFANTAVAPPTWDCRRCGLPAGRDRAHPPAAGRVPSGKSHLTHVHERRDVDAGEALLEEALAKLRALNR